MTLPTLAAPKHRIGVLVPPANPTVEIEYPALAPNDVAMHFMRLPVIAGDLQDRNKAYTESYAQSLKGFGSLKLDAVAIAMTGPQYRLGLQGDIDLCNRLSDAAGIAVETASIALVNALQSLGVTRINLLSPYPAWLTEMAVQYWEGAGLHVNAKHEFSDELVAYQLTPDAVTDGVLTAARQDSGALLLSGTGMRTLEALAAAAPSTSTPIISSNICSVWSITRVFRQPPSDWMTRTLPNALLPSVPF